jgi:hypothetical protein
MASAPAIMHRAMMAAMMGAKGRVAGVVALRISVMGLGLLK